MYKSHGLDHAWSYTLTPTPPPPPLYLQIYPAMGWGIAWVVRSLFWHSHATWGSFVTPRLCTCKESYSCNFDNIGMILFLHYLGGNRLELASCHCWLYLHVRTYITVTIVITKQKSTGGWVIEAVWIWILSFSACTLWWSSSWQSGTSFNHR